MSELYRKHRPKSLDGVVGQSSVVAMVKSKLDSEAFPHASLWSGPSGCGKTTLARIVAKRLGCKGLDFDEIDFASMRGIDTVRSIQSRMMLSPINGECKVFLIDEAHKATGDAQSGLLKMLEDCPDHVYFMLATTDPQKLLKTIRTRCMEFGVKSLSPADMKLVLSKVAEKEKVTLSDDVVEGIIEAAEGSARKALVILDSIASLPEDERKASIQAVKDARDVGIHICRKLLDARTKWDELRGLLSEATEEPETLRRMILSYATSVLLGGGKLADRAYFIILAFEGHFYDSGKAGLVRSCYEVFQKK